MLTIAGEMPEEPIARWATPEEVEEEVAKSKLTLSKTEAQVGEDVGFRGVLTVPQTEKGDHTVKVLFDDQEMASATLKVTEGGEEKEYSARDVNELVNRDFGAKKDSKEEGKRLYADVKYMSMSDETLREYLDAIKYISQHDYKTRTHDCDEFSFEAMGVGNNPKFGGYLIAVVWAWWKKNDQTIGHAFNAVLKETSSGAKLVPVEPQTGKTFTWGRNWHLWLFEA